MTTTEDHDQEAQEAQEAQGFQRPNGTPNRISFANMSLREATMPSMKNSNEVIGKSCLVTFSSCMDGAKESKSQTIQAPLLLLPRGPFQTPPTMMKRKRRPSTVTPPREQPKRDILWIPAPPLLPSDLDLNFEEEEEGNDDENSPSLVPRSRVPYNPFRNINNRTTRTRTQELLCKQDEEETEDTTSRTLPRAPLSCLGFPNIPTLEDSPATLKVLAAASSASSLPPVPTVEGILRNKKAPLKMRRLN